MIVVVCLWCHYSTIQIRSNLLIWKGEYWLRYSSRVGIHNLSCSCMWRGVCVGGGGVLHLLPPYYPIQNGFALMFNFLQFFFYVMCILCLAFRICHFTLAFCIWHYQCFRSFFGPLHLAFCTLPEWTIAFVLLFVATEKTLPSFTAVTFPRFSISETQ